jgi:tetratricopeptide (TPR) repeat protein
VAQLRHATRLAPDSAAVHHDLATLLLRQRSYTEARTELDAAIRLRPDFFEAYVNRGVVEFAEGRTASAIAWYERSLAIAGDNPTAHYNLGFAYTTLGNFESARRHYQRASAIAPHDTQSLLGLARLSALQQRLPDAMAGYRRVLTLEPRMLGALLDLAWILATSADGSVRDAAEAVRLAERALDTSPSDLPTSLDVLAAAYAADGQTARAVATARRALTLVSDAGGPDELRDGLARRLATYEALEKQRPPR